MLPSGYVQAGQWEEAVGLLDEMLAGTRALPFPDVFSFTEAMIACSLGGQQWLANQVGITIYEPTVS